MGDRGDHLDLAAQTVARRLRLHRGIGLLQQQEGRGDVGADGELEVLGRLLEKIFEPADAGAVDERVDPPEARETGLDRLQRLIGEIAGRDAALDAPAFQPGSQRLEVGRGARGEQQLHARSSGARAGPRR